jgi:hypothetical protein
MILHIFLSLHRVPLELILKPGRHRAIVSWAPAGTERPNFQGFIRSANQAEDARGVSRCG